MGAPTSMRSRRVRVGAARTVASAVVTALLALVASVAAGDGAVLGLELQVNDASGGARTSATTWHDPTGLSFVNP